MEKQILREKLLDYLKSIDAKEKLKIENNLYHKIIESYLWQNAKMIGITCSASFEWNTYPLIKMAWALNKEIVVPKSFPTNKQLKFYLLEDMNDLHRGYANLLEPDPKTSVEISNHKIDLLFVPGIVFDQRGYRIGFGGGYYDRFLLKHHNVTTVSLASDEQIIETVPTGEFDIAVENIVTNTRWINTY